MSDNVLPTEYDDNVERKRTIRLEIILLFGLSLGRSAIYSVIELIGRLTDNVPLGDQVTALNPSRSPRPNLDLAFQLSSIFFALMPVVLALFFLRTRREADGRPAFHPRNALGLNWSWRDVAKGFGLFAAVGIPGLIFFAIGRFLGITVQVQASALQQFWWTIPVLFLSAFQNGALEEIIVVGYLYRRTQDLGWSQGNRIDLRFLFASAVLRGSYHLYQGIGPFIGNFVMGLFFAWWFQSRPGRKRIVPLVIAHTLLDSVAFVGYQFAPATLLNLIGLG